MWIKETTQNKDTTFTMTVKNGSVEVAKFHSMYGESIEAFKYRADNLASDVMPDDKNETYLFSCTDTELLVKIAKGIIDPVLLAKKQLANRGLSLDGLWIGFDKAKKENF